MLVTGLLRQRIFLFTGAAGFALAATASSGTLAAPTVRPEPSQAYSPPVRDPAMTNLYWGDTHLHTQNSADAYINGTRLSAGDAFRFARGEEVVADNGMRVKLRRPLDFLAVADHSEYLGVYPRLASGDASLKGWALARQWAQYLADPELRKGLGRQFALALERAEPEYRTPVPFQRTLWEEVVRTADRYNAPNRFTAFAAYEWSSMPGGNNLHRVILFRDGAERTGQIVPFSAQDSPDPEDLWKALAEYEQETGGEVLAIPHNGNVSNGLMFALTTLNGLPMNAAYARTRSRWEPVYEVTQVKGDGETHPTLSPTDEFANFERWDQGNISLTAPKQPWMLQHEYARSSLRLGLAQEAKLGVNPFKFGLIGSTDSHTGLSTTSEDNFFGKFVESEPSPTRYASKMSRRLQESWQLGASGLAAVWADQNSRSAIFAAFKRREVYGTTGSRIMVRFFGGWRFARRDVHRPDYVSVGYSKGVPMGGEIIRQGKSARPSFMVVAAKDPDGANLDRIQIVKGWLDTRGMTHESVYDVALSGGRKADARTGNAPLVGNTVDVAGAAYFNNIGAAELSAVWTDPEFDPTQRAFYYVRVLEIPTPRWTAYDARYFDIKMPKHVPMVLQDRAYTSPIWYRP